MTCEECKKGNHDKYIDYIGGGFKDLLDMDEPMCICVKCYPEYYEQDTSE